MLLRQSFYGLLLLQIMMSVSVSAYGKEDWNDPLDVAIVTTEDIASRRLPVLRVRREAGHGGWQFYDNTDLTGKKAVVLPKPEILRLDPSLTEVIDLPVGWEAERAAKGAKWKRRKVQ